MIGGVDGTQRGRVVLSSKVAQGMFSGVKIYVEVGNGIGNIPLMVMPVAIPISEGVNFVPSHPVQSRGVKELGVGVSLQETSDSGLKLPKLILHSQDVIELLEKSLLQTMEKGTGRVVLGGMDAS